MSKGASYAVMGAGAAAIFGGLFAAGFPWLGASFTCIWLTWSSTHLAKQRQQR